MAIKTPVLERVKLKDNNLYRDAKKWCRDSIGSRTDDNKKIKWKIVQRYEYNGDPKYKYSLDGRFNYGYNVYFYFKDPKRAMMFRLMWG